MPFTRDTNTLGELPPLFGALATRLRVLSELLGRSPVILCARRLLSHAPHHFLAESAEHPLATLCGGTPTRTLGTA